MICLAILKCIHVDKYIVNGQTPNPALDSFMIDDQKFHEKMF